MRTKVALTRPEEAEEFHTLEPGMLRIPPLANMVHIVDISQQIGVLCQKKMFFFFSRRASGSHMLQKGWRRANRQAVAAGESGCALVRYAFAE